MKEQLVNERKKLLVSIEKTLEGPMVFLVSNNLKLNQKWQDIF